MTTPTIDDPSFQEAVRARVTLLEQARSVLPPGAKLDQLDERAIREAVLHRVYGVDVDYTGKSTAYIVGLYTHALSAGRLDAAGAEEKPAPRTAAATRRDGLATEPFVPDWQKPLSFGRARNASNVALATSLKQIKRGGVARDAQGRVLPDWCQPLSFHTDSPKAASSGAKPAPLDSLPPLQILR